jgi:hypothetical protein
MIRSKRIKWTGHQSHMEKKRNAYRVLMGEPEGKRPPGRPKL